MRDEALEQGNIRIRKTKAILHKMYEKCVDEIIFAFSPFLDKLYHLEKNAPEEGRREWLKRERRKLITTTNPAVDMLNIIRTTQRKAYPVALAPIRDIYYRNFIYIISEIRKEIELTADLLLDMWAAGLLNDYDELIEDSERDDPQRPEAKAIAQWRDSLYEEVAGKHATENFLNSLPMAKGESTQEVKRGIREVVAVVERHTDRFLDNIDSHFTSAGRVEGGEKLLDEFPEEFVDDTEMRKVWVCTFENSRDSHMLMHLQDRAMDEDFISGLGNVLRFPGDMLAPVEDWINCKCYVVVTTREGLEQMRREDPKYGLMEAEKERRRLKEAANK